MGRASKEGQGPPRAVEPMMMKMMMIYKVNDDWFVSLHMWWISLPD